MIPLGHYTELTLRGITPFLWCLGLGLLTFVPLGIAYGDLLMPNLLLAAAFYWMINRPQLMPNSVLFLLGLMYDLLNGGLIGCMSLALIAAARFTNSQRRIFTGRMFVVSWWGFVIVAVGYGAVNWAIVSMLTRGSIDPTTTAVQTLMTVAAYPLVALGLGRFQRRVLD
ncbi:rod shape-determining protein MreD [Govanella unica]|uniref:Rod shape-determining protein MreD n=1 Tax=Govanella unica TaxID=2975056 RepID=A0A9X3TXK4_9PROT|nr:rod shape-determining protein MreD [Govania unica]MDA5193479.1 rod shape-determining protein MreD [Govania unica]